MAFATSSSLMVRWSSWFRTPACHAGDHEFESRTDRNLDKNVSFDGTFFCWNQSLMAGLTLFIKVWYGRLLICTDILANLDEKRRTR